MTKQLQDTITAQLAEIKKLKAELKRWKTQSDDWQKMGWDLGNEVDSLKVINAEMLGALKEIASFPGPYLEIVHQIANAAIARTKGK